MSVTTLDQCPCPCGGNWGLDQPNEVCRCEGCGATITLLEQLELSTIPGALELLVQARHEAARAKHEETLRNPVSLPGAPPISSEQILHVFWCLKLLHVIDEAPVDGKCGDCGTTAMHKIYGRRDAMFCAHCLRLTPIAGVDQLPRSRSLQDLYEGEDTLIPIENWGEFRNAPRIFKPLTAAEIQKHMNALWVKLAAADRGLGDPIPCPNCGMYRCNRLDPESRLLCRPRSPSPEQLASERDHPLASGHGVVHLPPPLTPHFPPPLSVQKLACECGAAKCGDNQHSSWCPARSK